MTMDKIIKKYRHHFIEFLVSVYPIIVMVIPTGLLINMISMIFDEGTKKNNIICKYILNHYKIYGTIFFFTLIFFSMLIVLLWYKYYKIFTPIKEKYKNSKEKNNIEEIEIKLSDLISAYREKCILINTGLILSGIYFIVFLYFLYHPNQISNVQIFILTFSIFFSLIFFVVFPKKFYLLLIFLIILIISLYLFINIKNIFIFYFLIFASIPMLEYWILTTFEIKKTDLIEKFF